MYLYTAEFLCLVGAGPTVLIGPGFEILASLTDVSFGAVHSVALNSIDEVGLFSLGCLSFTCHCMYRLATEGVGRFQGNGNAKEF